MKKLIAFIALSLTSTAVFAGGMWTSVSVKGVQIFTGAGFPPNGVLLVTLASNATGGASCGSNYPATLAVDIKDPAGSAAASLLMRALTLGYAVSLTGTGGCTVDSSVETLRSVTTTQ